MVFEICEPATESSMCRPRFPRIPVPAPGVIADCSQEGAAESQAPFGCDSVGPPFVSVPTGFARSPGDPKGGGSVPVSRFGIQYGQLPGRKNQRGGGI
jgi:hypothetical protein